MADALDGTQLAYSAYGEPKSDTSMQLAHGAVQPAAFGLPYIPVHQRPNRIKKCRANNDTCNGWKITGSDYCPVHAGKLLPGGRAAEPTLSEPKASEEVGVEPPADA